MGNKKRRLPFVKIFPNQISLKKITTQEGNADNHNESIPNYINESKNRRSINFIKSRKKEEQTFYVSYEAYEEVLR